MFMRQLVQSASRAPASYLHVANAARLQLRGFAAAAAEKTPLSSRSKGGFSLHQKDVPVEVYPLIAVVGGILSVAGYYSVRAWSREPDLRHHRSTGNPGTTYF